MAAFYNLLMRDAENSFNINSSFTQSTVSFELLDNWKDTLGLSQTTSSIEFCQWYIVRIIAQSLMGVGILAFLIGFGIPVLIKVRTLII